MNELNELIKTRQFLHEHPELSMQEYKTTAWLIDQLDILNVEYFTPLDTGVIAVISGAVKETIAFRADIDALPIQEENEIPFNSKNNNIMHACGHDGHTAMLLAWLKRVLKMKTEGCLNYRTMFIFQPSEETMAGANQLIKAFDFNAYQIQAIYGIHMMPDNPEGELVLRDLEMTASATEYRFYVEGLSAHVANKEQGNSANEAVLMILHHLAQIQQFHLSGLNRNIVHIGRFNAGEAINTVASNGYVEGTIRTYDMDDLQIIKDKMQDIKNAVELITHTKVSVKFEEGYPPVINSPELSHRVKSAVKSAGLTLVEKENPYLFGEDFSFYNSIAPSYFVFLGCRNEEKGYIHGLHTSKFNFDERVLLNGLNFYESLLKGYSL